MILLIQKLSDTLYVVYILLYSTQRDMVPCVRDRFFILVLSFTKD